MNIRLQRYAPFFLGALRIVSGLLFFEHGTAKVARFPHNPMFDHLTPLFYTAGYIEFVCGMFLIIGLFTRTCAFIAAGEMAVAYWFVHVPAGGLLPALNGGSEAILYSFIFLYIAVAGPGRMAAEPTEWVGNAKLD